MVVAVLTPELCARVAELLTADDYLTVMHACLEAGCPWGPVKSAMQRLRDGTGGTMVAPIALAVERQCRALLDRGEQLANEGTSASWYQWRLETKHPTAYGRRQAVEVSGQLDTSAVASKSDAELLAIIQSDRGEE